MQLRLKDILIVAMHYVRVLGIHKLEGLRLTPIINIHTRVLTIHIRYI